MSEKIDSKKKAGNLFKKGTMPVSIGLIIILGFLVYANSLNGKFILDDESLVHKNIYIKNWSNISKIFTKDIAAGGKEKWNSYRPIQMITYMMDYSLWKLDSRGYHLSNTLLHILAALAVYWLINILYDDKALSLLTGLLFVAHPVHTGAVSYISGRADSLVTIFMFFSLILYIKYLHSKDTRVFIIMLLSYILALLSRENSLTLPILLLLYHYVFRKKIAIAQFLTIFGIAFVYILLRITVLRALMFNIVYSTSFLQRMPGFFVAITNYTRLMFLPLHLHAEYGKKLCSFGDPKAVVGIVIAFFALLYALEKRKSNKLIFFSVSWFFITLLPQSNLYPVNAYMAEHWLYVPIMGFLLILANALIFLYRRKGFRILAAALIIGLLSFYSWLTIRQNAYWRDPLVFYERSAQHASWSAKVYNNLGNAYNARGKYKEAIDAFRKAMEIDPNFPKPYINLGNSLYALKKYEDAIALYKKAMDIDPGLAEIHYNLANTYNALKRYEDAVTCYKKAIEIDPSYKEAYSNLGTVYYALKRYEDAVNCYKKAIGIAPDYTTAHSNLGNAYSALGKYEDAIALHKKAIRIDPNVAKVHYNLGNTYNTIERYEDAISSYRKTLEINPDFGEAHYNLAVIYYYKKQYDLAIEHYDRAVKLGHSAESEFLEALMPHRTP